MLFPIIVMKTFPVPGLLAGMIFETTTASYVRVFNEDPRSEPTETVIEIREAEPRTLNDLTEDSEIQFVADIEELRAFALAV